MMRNNKGQFIATDIKERFIAKYMPEPMSGCWLWIGGHNSKSGYGTIWHDGYMQKAHRVSYMLYKGMIPKNIVVRHTCDNPHCVNPDHLILGTHKDNSQDAVKRKRLAKVKQTHCIKGHPLFGDNLRITKRGNRTCVECAHERDKAYAAKRAEERKKNPKPRKTKTHCIRGHHISRDNVYTHPKRGTKECLACRKLRNKRANEKAKEKRRLKREGHLG